MPAMLLRSKTKTNPLFYADQVRLLLQDDPDRVERILNDPENVDLLTWNVFSSLNTDTDREYVAGLLRMFCGNDLQPPVSLSVWTGKLNEPHLKPSAQYVRYIKERAGDDAQLDEFTSAIEAPVRIESGNVLGLVDTTLDGQPRGRGGRDRLVELVDAGLVHAERVSKELAVAVVYRSGTRAAADLSRRINELRDPAALKAALPWRANVPAVRFREVTWQQLIKTWENERGHLKLFGEPVKQFLAHTERLGLR